MVADVIIYGLIDSGDPATIRYVGKTSLRRRRARLLHHLWQATKGGADTHKSRWIRSVINAGREVHDVILATSDGDDHGNRLEVSHIAALRFTGQLTNSTDGGEGTPGCSWTPERLAKFRAAMVGKKRSPQDRERNRVSHLGQRVDREKRLATFADPTLRAKLSESAYRRWARTPDRRKTVEHRRKIGEANAKVAARKRAAMLAIQGGA